MAEEVNRIRLYENGYAFVTDVEGNVVYHPRMDVTNMDPPPVVPGNQAVE